MMRMTQRRMLRVNRFLLLLFVIIIGSTQASKDKEAAKAPKTSSPQPTRSPRPTSLPVTFTPTRSPSDTDRPTQAPTPPTREVPLPALRFAFASVEQQRTRKRRLQQQKQRNTHETTTTATASAEDTIDSVDLFLHDYFQTRYGESFCCLATNMEYEDSNSNNEDNTDDDTVVVTGDATFYTTTDATTNTTIPSADDLASTLATYLSFMGPHDLHAQAGRQVRSVAIDGIVVATAPGTSSTTNDANAAITNPFVIAGLLITIMAVLGTLVLVVLRARRLEAEADAATAPTTQRRTAKAAVPSDDAVQHMHTAPDDEDDSDDDDSDDDARVQIPQPSYIRPYGGTSVPHPADDDHVEDVADDSYTSDGDIISLASSMKSASQQQQQQGPLFAASNQDNANHEKWAKSVRK